ncbi:unnamed protein product [Leptidea sinapis]|uniref:Carbohydrate kinase FGGY C-terminal domain-containing protein n=1 Tax=Leptidea sinapis TaxID=189913 RepID=A0A5E4R0Z1_9NEOP|nr:unnamed protein product [Leptidea sinapis]
MRDQQSALVGQNCLRFGQVKCTYGTGCESIVHSQNGLLTTVAYKMGPDEPPVYALEGSVAIAGDTMQWLKHGLGIVNEISDTDVLAMDVADNEEGSVCFVPAFNGLYSPQWRKDARGTCRTGSRLSTDMRSCRRHGPIVAGRALRVWPASTPKREIRRLRWEKALDKSLGWAQDDSNQPIEKLDEIDNAVTALPSGLFFLGTALLVILADKLKV